MSDLFTSIDNVVELISANKPFILSNNIPSGQTDRKVDFYFCQKQAVIRRKVFNEPQFNLGREREKTNSFPQNNNNNNNKDNNNLKKGEIWNEVVHIILWIVL